MEKGLQERIKRIFKNHTTQDTAITRKQLQIELMTSDRMARKTIEKAKGQGIPIVSSSRTKGYWLNAEDYERITIPEYKARIKAKSKVINAYFSDDPDQMSLDDYL